MNLIISLVATLVYLGFVSAMCYVCYIYILGTLKKMSFEILTFFVSIFGIYFFVESMFYLADHCISTTIFNSKTDIVLIFIAMFAMCFLGYQIYQMADIIRY